MIASLYHNPGYSAASIGAAAAVHSHAIADLPVADAGETSAAKVVRADDPRLSDTEPGPHTHVLADVNGLVSALDDRPLLATAAPAPLGTLSQVGVAATAARADHVHLLPAAADIGITTDQLWQTGDYKHTAAASAPPGWIFADGRTIGAAGSGASSRAHADTEALFGLLYNSCSDAILPVSGGRGSDAAADFAAGKTITLPDLRGRALFGCDTMGGVAANRIAASGTGNPGIAGGTLGASGGTDRHPLSVAEMPAHTHTLSPSVWSAEQGVMQVTHTPGGNAFTTVSVTGQAGSGAAHPQMPPALICTILIKL